MKKSKCYVLLTALCCIAICICQCEGSCAKEKELTPERVIAEHLKSLGTPDALSRIQTRTAVGTITYKIVHGASGSASGQAQWASEKGKMGLVMRFNDVDYPGEHFAFDGENIGIAETVPGRMSYLGNFFHSWDSRIIRNGLLGGVLSMDWPLLDIKASGAKFKYRRKNVDGREFHELTYDPPKTFQLGRGVVVEVKMYFDVDTFHHVMTEYRYGQPYYDHRLNYVILQKFDYFKEVDGITLPFNYTLRYSSGDHVFTYVLDISKMDHNLKIDPQFYIVKN